MEEDVGTIDGDGREEGHFILELGLDSTGLLLGIGSGN